MSPLSTTHIYHVFHTLSPHNTIVISPHHHTVFIIISPYHITHTLLSSSRRISPPPTPRRWGRPSRTSWRSRSSPRRPADVSARRRRRSPHRVRCRGRSRRGTSSTICCAKPSHAAHSQPHGGRRCRTPRHSTPVWRWVCTHSRNTTQPPQTRTGQTTQTDNGSNTQTHTKKFHKKETLTYQNMK